MSNKKGSAKLKLNIPVESPWYNTERLQIRILADMLVLLTQSPNDYDFIYHGKPIVEDLYKRFHRILKACSLKKCYWSSTLPEDVDELKSQSHKN
jgi:hypothetical protein